MKKYSLSELEKRYGLSSGTLRYYDQNGILPIFQRTESGQRYVDEADISSVELLIMLKKAGCSLQTIRRIIELTNRSRENPKELSAIHSEIASQLDLNTEERIQKLAEITSELQISRYLSWFFHQSTEAGTMQVHTGKNRARYEGSLPLEFLLILDRILGVDDGQKEAERISSSIQIPPSETIENYQNAMLEKYPDYPIHKE